jgi:hypothetical protein
VESERQNPPIEGSCTLKKPNWPLQIESERQNLSIEGSCTLKMPNWPLEVESERQNPSIGGSCTLKMPNQPIKLEKKATYKTPTSYVSSQKSATMNQSTKTNELE